MRKTKRERESVSIRISQISQAHSPIVCPKNAKDINFQRNSWHYVWLSFSVWDPYKVYEVTLGKLGYIFSY